MAISFNPGASSYISSSNVGGSSYCATCGRTATNKTNQTYSGSSYSGRTDSYTCATCGKSSASSNARTTYRPTSTTTSTSYCPTCGKTHSGSSSASSHWSGGTTTTVKGSTSNISWAR